MARRGGRCYATPGPEMSFPCFGEKRLGASAGFDTRAKSTLTKWPAKQASCVDTCPARAIRCGRNHADWAVRLYTDARLPKRAAARGDCATQACQTSGIAHPRSTARETPATSLQPIMCGCRVPAGMEALRRWRPPVRPISKNPAKVRTTFGRSSRKAVPKELPLFALTPKVPQERWASSTSLKELSGEVSARLKMFVMFRNICGKATTCMLRSGMAISGTESDDNPCNLVATRRS